MTRKVTVVIEKDEDGYYAFAPALKGCQTQGDTLDEAMANIREAVALYLESLDDDERRQASAVDLMTASVEVAVGSAAADDGRRGRPAIDPRRVRPAPR